ncbi:hypothetical protein DPEC_G00116300 [Dallia pectoralis]|uniref:Uncharacterized protein n=1 Tax=Dallia pectoralis TaxID=75939 RepID=A0ACC2GU56_DALPE|nr:hypothetical protein DPEC_G00116300 [Dallia pectoralis]
MMTTPEPWLCNQKTRRDRFNSSVESGEEGLGRRPGPRGTKHWHGLTARTAHFNPGGGGGQLLFDLTGAVGAPQARGVAARDRRVPVVCPSTRPVYLGKRNVDLANYC